MIGNMYGLWQARDYLQGKTLYHEEDHTFNHAAKNVSSHGPTSIPFLYKTVRGKYPSISYSPPPSSLPPSSFSFSRFPISTVHLSLIFVIYHHKVGDKKNAKKPVVFFSEDTHYSIVKVTNKHNCKSTKRERDKSRRRRRRDEEKKRGRAGDMEKYSMFF